MKYKTKALLFSQLETETFQANEPILYEILWDDVKFEILINYNQSVPKVVVFGTGDIIKSKQILPVFSRATWMNNLSCTGIWYFDPTVYLGEATLCWGYGTNARWYLKDIAALLKVILAKLEIAIENTLFFGSSGGGYTAMLLAAMLQSKATAINPQLIPSEFWATKVQLLKETVLSSDETLIPERTNAARLFVKENYFPKIHILQNIKSKNDMNTQLIPFLSELTALDVDCRSNLKIDFYSDEGGHNAMPSKEETLRLIHMDLTEEALPLIPKDPFNSVITATSYEIKDQKLYYYLQVSEEDAKKYTFAFYLLKDDEPVQKIFYKPEPSCAFTLPPEGLYSVKYFLNDGKRRKSFLDTQVEVPVLEEPVIKQESSEKTTI